ncbi:hypothetical protein CAEBREN_21166 [Caenorhabditis brenneri]|uniref:DNA2/NAM7 helicase-like C-terminal domain-containing protein n=1 Tax=Caenorhabditis brenneri TaxID=135651 RepID=G0NKI4_CAEBE|nr:hypothetical protein CAEBREN_21166 [Caenorhabditis brenneri]
MDRNVNNKEKFSLIMFDEQYRCNEQIMRWSNETFYGELLQNKWSQDNTLTDVQYFSKL